MKNFTLVLLMLFAATGFAQSSASGSATVNAEIVSPISISEGSDLNFGSINGSSTGGDVTVQPNGNRTFTNSELEITSATTVTAAQFNITAANGFSYDITIPDIVLTGPGDDMDLTFTHDRRMASNRIGSGSEQELNVGGTLTVNNNQEQGAYSGTVNVTVNYN